MITDLFFPRACLSCGARGHAMLCPPCAAAVRWIEDGCARCGAPAAAGAAPCRSCRARDHAFASARAAAVYVGPARDVLLSYKLGGERRAARPIAATMLAAIARAEHAGPGAARPDVVTFVPATRASHAARGFNPAEELARHVARGIGRPCRGLLAKTRETADQAGLDRARRAVNLAGAFAARLGRRSEESVLLVDDILTTGATADACARALHESGISRVDVLTFARAV